MVLSAVLQPCRSLLSDVCLKVLGVQQSLSHVGDVDVVPGRYNPSCSCCPFFCTLSPPCTADVFLPTRLHLTQPHLLPSSHAQVFLTTVYYKRWKWSPLKSRRLIVDVVN